MITLAPGQLWAFTLNQKGYLSPFSPFLVYAYLSISQLCHDNFLLLSFYRDKPYLAEVAGFAISLDKLHLQSLYWTANWILKQKRSNWIGFQIESDEEFNMIRSNCKIIWRNKQIIWSNWVYNYIILNFNLFLKTSSKITSFYSFVSNFCWIQWKWSKLALFWPKCQIIWL